MIPGSGSLLIDDPLINMPPHPSPQPPPLCSKGSKAGVTCGGGRSGVGDPAKASPGGNHVKAWRALALRLSNADESPRIDFTVAIHFEKSETLHAKHFKFRLMNKASLADSSYKSESLYIPRISLDPKRPSSSLVVFGNGRTHTGEVDGSGGSRLANYCLRASTSEEKTAHGIKPAQSKFASRLAIFDLRGHRHRTYVEAFLLLFGSAIKTEGNRLLSKYDRLPAPYKMKQTTKP
ncbi:Hypothetical predicted protein [Scomber scombrus]|uniref:Uncharacterized protein n=1 Tax=Scomber scombrus TaxID=13677 RepID=A0AAV1NSF5_SCOSC